MYSPNTNNYDEQNAAEHPTVTSEKRVDPELVLKKDQTLRRNIMLGGAFGEGCSRFYIVAA